MIEVRIATRRSALARAQAETVAAMLRSAHPGLTARLVEVETLGDRDQTAPIAELTEVGAFVRSVQRAVISGEADLAVHSLKDLPVDGPSELEIVAFPERQAPNDVLVGASLGAIPEGGVVGTGSPRRAAQLLELRPDLVTAPMRGNVDTRLAKLEAGTVRAAILAQAGLDRLGRADAIAQVLSALEMVPAPGQGALAVEALQGSPAAEIARSIDSASLRPLLEAERLVLSLTGAGCRSALGAIAAWVGTSIRIDSFVSDEAGARRATAVGDTPQSAVAATRSELGI